MSKAPVFAALSLSLLLLAAPACLGDGGYFSSESIAVSSDQRAIIIKFPDSCVVGLIQSDQ